MEGQSVFVASDDFGSAGEVYNAATGGCDAGSSAGVNEISADPYVTSVGGTQFHPLYPTATPTPSNRLDVGFVEEGVLDVLSGPAPGASGGGVSQVFSKPNYQAGRTPADGQRDVPDVAMMAGAFDANGNPNPGAFWADDSNRSGSYCPSPGPCISCCVGGTSLATALWAGVSKLIQQQRGERIGNINPELYSLAELGPAAGIRDVTVNANPNNNGFAGVSGWPAENLYDLATGWGTPDITTFVNLFSSSQVVLLGGLTSSGNIQTGEAYNPVTQQFSSLGQVMSTGRVAYAAAKLPDGTILLAGGDNGSTNLKTADIYNPVTNTFTQTAHNMANAYFDFAQAVTLQSQPTPTSGYAHGGVFIIGDQTTDGILWTEIYDPVNQSFTSPVKILGNNEPQIGYKITLLGNGKVLIQGYTSTAQVYDPIAKTFTKTANQPPEPVIPSGQHEPLSDPAAVLLSNGMVLVAGGEAGSVYPSTFAYLYNPATNTFWQTGSLNEARCAPSAIALPNGNAMVYGDAAQNNVAGSCTFDATVEIYDPKAGTFTQAQMTTTRGYPFASVIPNSTVPYNLTAQVLIAGGFGAGGSSYLNTAEIYDPTLGGFTALSSTMTVPTVGGVAFPAR